MKPYRRIAFVASSVAEAETALFDLSARYGNVEPDEADVIVALGGDGLMISTLHRFICAGKPIYGMHRGSVGFLMNEFDGGDLLERVNAAEETAIHPLRMRAVNAQGEEHVSRAFNEVSLLRATHQAAKLRVLVDGTARLDELVCDGVLVSTPAGSTAYNLSAHGPILPIDSPLLALTPISAFRPRRWRGALLSNEAKMAIEILEADKRPVNAVADNTEFRSIVRVDIAQDRSRSALILFDPGHNLDERILSEQFRF